MEASGQPHAPAALFSVKEPRELGGLQSRSGRVGEEKNSLTLPGIEPPIIHPVAQHHITELSWLVTESSLCSLTIRESVKRFDIIQFARRL
jgi:hypothetical protein